MSKHPERSEILRAFVTGFRGKGQSELRSHIDACEECSRYLDRLRAHTSPAAISGEEPGREVLARILRSRSAMQPASSINNLRRSLSGRRMAAALAGAAFIIFAGLTALYLGTEIPGAPSIAVSEYHGTVDLSGKKLPHRDAVAKGAVLNTSKDASVTIAFKGHFTVELSPETRLTVQESMYDADKKSYVFAFNLERGTVHSRFSHTGTAKEYSFTTPQARLDSIGTDFILTTDDEHTVLVLNEGTLRLTGLQSGQAVRGSAGRRYVIGAGISATLLDGSTGGAVIPIGTENDGGGALKEDRPAPGDGKKATGFERRDDRARDRMERRELLRERREMMRDGREERQDMRREQREMIRQNRMDRPIGRPGR